MESLTLSQVSGERGVGSGESGGEGRGKRDEGSEKRGGKRSAMLYLYYVLLLRYMLTSKCSDFCTDSTNRIGDLGAAPHSGTLH